MRKENRKNWLSPFGSSKKPPTKKNRGRISMDEGGKKGDEGPEITAPIKKPQEKGGKYRRS